MEINNSVNNENTSEIKNENGSSSVNISNSVGVNNKKKSKEKEKSNKNTLSEKDINEFLKKLQKKDREEISNMMAILLDHKSDPEQKLKRLGGSASNSPIVNAFKEAIVKYMKKSIIRKQKLDQYLSEKSNNILGIKSESILNILNFKPKEEKKEKNNIGELILGKEVIKEREKDKSTTRNKESDDNKKLNDIVEDVEKDKNLLLQEINNIVIETAREKSKTAFKIPLKIKTVFSKVKNAQSNPYSRNMNKTFYKQNKKNNINNSISL